jgi:peptidoglycan/LPS O-acetylase OafA/YrhL
VSFRGKRWTAALLSIGGAIVYQLAPNQPALFLAYFWIWWAGVELAREYLETQRVTFSAQRPALAVLGLCTAIWAWPVFAAVRAHAALSPGLHPVLEFRHFAAASLMLVAGIWYLSAHRRPTRAGRLFAWMAPISYGLYISHRPVINAIQMAGLPRVLTIALTVVAALAMAYLLEIVIHPWCVRRMKSLWRAAARRGKTAGAASIVKVRS